jgi:hypothetical protein
LLLQLDDDVAALRLVTSQPPTASTAGTENGALKTPKVQHQQTKKRHRWIGGFLQSQAALKMTPNLYSKLKHNLYEVQN